MSRRSAVYWRAIWGGDLQVRDIEPFAWSGGRDGYLDAPGTTTRGHVVLGRYGSSTAAGAAENEDGALVLAGDAWEFAMLLDGHAGGDSAELLVGVVGDEADAIAELLSREPRDAFEALEAHLLALFHSDAFRARCRALWGEAACLLCARRGGFLWWLSIGDCLAYALHPDFARLGQYALNRRAFFQWIGRVNTFELPVPSYNRGVCELRRGWTRIVMVTDGLLEHGSRLFNDPAELYAQLTRGEPGSLPDLEANVGTALRRVHDERGRDSATVIAWDAYDERSPSMPTE